MRNISNLDKDLVLQAMIKTVPKKAVENNKKAFELGYQTAGEALKTLS